MGFWALRLGFRGLGLLNRTVVFSWSFRLFNVAGVEGLGFRVTGLAFGILRYFLHQFLKDHLLPYIVY